MLFYIVADNKKLIEFKIVLTVCLFLDYFYFYIIKGHHQHGWNIFNNKLMNIAFIDCEYIFKIIMNFRLRKIL